MNKLIERRKQIDGKVECYSIRELLSMIRDGDIVLAKSEMPMLFTTNMNAYRKMVDIFTGAFSGMLSANIDDKGVYHLGHSSSVVITCILKFMNGDMKFIEVSGSDLLEEVNPTSVDRLRSMLGKEKLYMHSTKKTPFNGFDGNG